VQFPWLDESAIDASAANLLRRTFDEPLLRSCPVDLDEVICYLSETDSLVFDDEADFRGIDSALVLGKTQPLRGRILLSRRLKLDGDRGRARFTLAHEIGHWMLHRPLYLAKARELSLFDGEEDREIEFVELTRTIFGVGGHPETPREEWQANRFATSLLVDRERLRREFHLRFETSAVARARATGQLQPKSLREHSRRLATLSLNGLSPLHHVFGLSAEAMAVALEMRGYSVETPPII
jgi:hypothetical protein